MRHTLTMTACARQAPHAPHTWRETGGTRRTLRCPGAQGDPAKARITLRADAFTDAALASYGWPTKSAAARALGINRSSLHRLVTGQITPGDRLIAALLVGTGRTFEALFTVEVDGRLHAPLPM